MAMVARHRKAFAAKYGGAARMRAHEPALERLMLVLRSFLFQLSIQC